MKDFLLIVLLAALLPLSFHCENAFDRSAPNSDDSGKLIKASSDQFLWQVDLHTLGYPSNPADLQWRRHLNQFNTIDFLSERIVVSTFVTQEEVPELAIRNDPNRIRPYKLHAVLLDSNTGTSIQTLEWPIDEPEAGIFSRFDGTFLFVSRERLVLYSEEGKPLKERELSVARSPHSSIETIAESVSGATLIIGVRNENKLQCAKVDTETLDASIEPCTVPAIFSISDSAIVEAERVISGIEDPGPVVKYRDPAPPAEQSPRIRMLIREAGKPTHALCEATVFNEPQFVNNELIAVYGINLLRLFDLTGQLKFQQQIGTITSGPWIDSGGRPLRPSASGQRFALALNKTVVRTGTTTWIGPRVGDPPAEFPDYVDIFDVGTNSWIYRLTNYRNQLAKIWGLALSPIGQKLVIDSGGVVRMYQLPSSSAQHSK